MSVSAINVGKYYLEKSGGKMELWKLMTLIYYAQAYHLGVYGQILFEEEIIRRDKGPVIEIANSFFQQYTQDKNVSLPVKIAVYDPIPTNTCQFLDAVYSYLGPMTNHTLSVCLHMDDPFTNTEKNESISIEKMNWYSKLFLADIKEPLGLLTLEEQMAHQADLEDRKKFLQSIEAKQKKDLSNSRKKKNL